ncbi:hypothetical protein DVH24_039654 [Malus domestica]|uniref:Uncharacterized protein n=1 Tax=Malus domestica TaxID=3750 RepID=A0A498I9B8_MALDO|nr:hypothetical protein DVH24_039654 [Malus domestica]
MSSFLEKLVLVVAALYLLLCVFPATSSSLPHGNEKNTLSHVGCGDGLTKIIGRKEVKCGYQSEIVSNKVVPVRRSLRLILTLSPPSPIKNAPKSQTGTLCSSPTSYMMIAIYVYNQCSKR